MYEVSITNIAYEYIVLVITMFMNILINTYLKNITIDKAILVSKQLCIDFNYKEMQAILPYVKTNWQGFLDENKRTFLLNDLANRTCPETAKKTDALLNKLLIILS
jgi:hypothetical protein